MKIVYVVILAALLSHCGGGGSSSPQKTMPASTVSESSSSRASSIASNLAPSAFSILRYKLTGSSIQLGWSESLDPENKPIAYKVFVNGKLNQADLHATSVELSALVAETSYQLRVEASDPEGMTVSTAVTVTTAKAGDSMAWQTTGVDNLQREYIVFAPPPINEDKRPLFIYLHGAGSHVQTSFDNIKLKQLAEREHFVALLPQALMDPSNSYTFWNPNAALPTSSPDYAGSIIGYWGGKNRDDVTFIAEAIKQVVAQYNIDTDRIYVAGMSSGGFMTFAVAQALSDRVAAVAPIAGLVTREMEPYYILPKSMPLLTIFGTQDSVVPITGLYGGPSLDSIIKKYINTNKASATPIITEVPDINTTDHSTVTKFEYKGLTPAGDVLFYRVNGGDHSIPGLGDGNYANQDIVALDVIWDFFKTRRLSDHY